MKSYLKITFGILWALLFVIGAIAFYERVTTGDTLTNLQSYVPWGLWVAAYIYFIGLSAGAFLLSSLAYGLGQKKLEPVGKYALFTALATLFMALLTIWSDIGHMPRAIEIFTRPQFHSMMAWMVWLYTSYFILLLAELFFAFRVDLPMWRSTSSGFKRFFAKLISPSGVEPSANSQKRDKTILKTLALIGIPLAVAFHGGVGALFATVAAQEIWHNPLYPIIFLMGALASGGAFLTALVVFFWPQKDASWKDLSVYLGRVTLGLILIDALLTWSEYSIPLWYGVGDIREIQSLNAVLFGQYWYVFWIFQVALGLVASAAILAAFPKRPKLIGFASALFAITFFAVRLDIVIPAFVEPQLQGLQSAYTDSRLTYSYLPSLFEWQLLLFVVTLGAAVLYLGYRYLPLTTPSEEQKVSLEART